MAEWEYEEVLWGRAEQVGGFDDEGRDVDKPQGSRWREKQNGEINALSLWKVNWFNLKADLGNKAKESSWQLYLKISPGIALSDTRLWQQVTQY